MKTVVETKKIGVWVDHEQARFLEPGKPAEAIQEMTSPVEGRVRFHGEGSSGSRVGKFRASNNEFGKQNREKNELHLYYKELAEVLKPYDEILLFGPTTAPNELLNFLQEDPHFRNKKMSTQKCDYMSDRKLAEFLRLHFED